MNIGEQAATHSESSGSSRPLLFFFLLWSVIIALAVFSVGALKPPAPLPASAPESEFSAAITGIRTPERALDQAQALVDHIADPSDEGIR